MFCLWRQFMEFMVTCRVSDRTNYSFQSASATKLILTVLKTMSSLSETQPELSDSSSPSLTYSTIYGLSSGQGKCGIAVIRISGAEATTVLKEMVNLGETPEPRHAYLRDIRCPISGETIDTGLVFWYPGPNSFTGEDVCEFQVHGGTAVVSAILEALSMLPDYRLARPDEFIKRAFHNNKIDLVEAEGIADLINAETEYQRKQALFQSQGALSKMYNTWSEEILTVLTRFQALFNIDEPRERSGDSIAQILQTIFFTYSEIAEHLRDGRRGERLRMGVDVVIVGEPNVGKSSLYNALCQRSAALVTPYPGTTRDVLDVRVDVSGYPVTLYDTCGIRMGKPVHPVETKEVDGAKNAVANAQVLIVMADARKFSAWRERNKTKPVTMYITQYMKKLELLELIDPRAVLIRQLFKKPCIVVFNKCDLLKRHVKEINFEGALPISIAHNTGMKELVQKLTNHVKLLCASPSSELPAITKIRHRALLEACCEKLRAFVNESSNDEDDEECGPDYAIMSSYLHGATATLYEITNGRSSCEPVSDVLDEIFFKFCIGK